MNTMRINIDRDGGNTIINFDDGVTLMELNSDYSHIVDVQEDNLFYIASTDVTNEKATVIRMLAELNLISRIGTVDRDGYEFAVFEIAEELMDEGYKTLYMAPLCAREW